MTGAPEYPLVDPRRVGQLRKALLRDIAAMAPMWRGAAEAQGPDRAIVEVAARLSEEATRRLDKTPQRDALAFLEMFDIAPPQPVAARGVTVFALKDGQTSPVVAKARTGVTIATLIPEGQAAVFETTQDLRIQPGSIAHLATVDPALDRLGLAPEAVTTLDPDLTVQPTYKLSTSAVAADSIVSINPPVGILPGDLLRIERTDKTLIFATVISFSEDGLTQLSVPLSDALDPSVRLERMRRLDAFAMPDAQEHALYIGDADVLAVKEPATFALRFDPARVAGILASEGAIFEIWGTRETPVEEDAPDWHPLVRLTSAGGDLKLFKAWTGPVDEVEVAGRKSRWIRIRTRDAIVSKTDNDVSPLSERTTVDRVTVGLETLKPENEDNETVSQVANNGAPLSVAAPFQPFGPEPLRFDIFSIAAPEAFTKPDARATLDFTLMDATLLALTASQRFDGRHHVYGIGSNGRLQVLDVTDDTVTWIEVTGPPIEPGSEQTFSLDPEAGLLAYAARDLASGQPDDMIVVTTTTGARFVGHIARQVGPAVTYPVALENWNPLPNLPDGALGDRERPSLAVLPQRISDMGFYKATLLIAMKSGLRRMDIPYTGNTTGRIWTEIGEADGPVLPPSPKLALVAGESEDTTVWFLTVATDGQVWLLRTDKDPATWTALETQTGDFLLAATGTTPAGTFYGLEGARRLAIATLKNIGSDLMLSMTQYNFNLGALEDPETKDLAATSFDAQTSLAVSRAINISTGQFPHTLGLQIENGVVRSFEWAPTHNMINEAASTALFTQPPDQKSFSVGIFLPDETQPGAKQVFAATDQTVVRLPINPSAAVDFNDWIAVPPNSTGNRVLITRFNKSTGEPEYIDPPFILAPIVDQTNEAAVFDIESAADRTDWDQDVVAYWTGDDLTLDYDSSTKALVDTDGGQGINGLVAGMIIVIPDEAQDSFGIFNVLAVGALSIAINPTSNPDSDSLQVTDSVRLDTLMGAGTAATIRKVVQVGTISANTDRPNKGTLLALGAAPFWPAQVSGFATSDSLIDVSAQLTGPEETKWVVLPAFSVDVPANNTLIKLLPAGTGPEIMQATTLTQSYSNPELSWEYFDGEGWKRLDNGFRDTTRDFASSGEVSFIVPRNLSITEIGGQEDYWIRARLVGGDYGRPRYIVENTATTQEVIVRTDHMRPPEVSRVSARVLLPPEHLSQHVIARNNMRDLDQTSANRLAGAAYPMFEGAYEVPMGDGMHRALLLGFTEPLEPGSASLFVTAIDQTGAVKLRIDTLGADNAWSPAPLTKADSTNGLLRTGLISLSVSEMPAQVLMFGKTLYWMRLQPVDNVVDWAPQITGIWLNGVPVVQAETVRQELMGGAQGEPNLELALLKPPVLAGSLELRVRESISDEEITVLRALRARGALEPALQVPNLTGTWVLWHQVTSLIDQAPDARVYVLSAKGTVRFGDGQSGRIVLAGRDNIRAFSYLSGGQRVETLAFADAKPRGSIEGLDKVLVPAPIAGGSAPPDDAELIARMPHVLRHAGMGLSLSDIEALARDADSQIVQVKAFAPTPSRDAVLLAVLARGKNRMPTYSLAQRDSLRGVLSARMTDAFQPDCLNVVSVGFVALVVAVDLIARPGALAALETDANNVLNRFLHAAEGGPEGRGWPPGRVLWPNDIRRALASIPSLDRISKVDVKWPTGRGPDTLAANEVITTKATRCIIVNVTGEAAI